MQHIERIAIDARLLEIAEELSAGCDPDFDDDYEELELEFHALTSLIATLQ
ncbi:MAG: hypothetical protein NTW75_00365 [Planctomycetales bacterium]|nr:hypothetical protein [Planctomycetales bacterium]